MSVKCGYSSAYYPLLKNLLRGDSPDLNAFKVFINEHFTNPDEVFNMFVSGVYTDSAPTPVSEPKKISSRLGIELPPEGSSPQQYYIDNSRQYNKMIDDTAKRIISMSVFDINSAILPPTIFIVVLIFPSSSLSKFPPLIAAFTESTYNS